MLYNKKTWVSGEIITEESLNNIENGIATLDENLLNCVKSINGVTPNENGNVTISATLEPPSVVNSIKEMVDTNKQYVLSTDGYIYSYKKVDPAEAWIDVLTNIGYQENKRINSSGQIVTYSNVDLTNYIPCKIGDVVKLEGFSIPSTYVSGAYHQEVSLYSSDKTWLGKFYLCVDIAANKIGLNLVEKDGYIVEFTLTEGFVSNKAAYMVISSQDITSNSKVLVKGIKATIPNFTNLADVTSDDWLNNARLSTSSTDFAKYNYVSNYIPCKKDDIIRVKGMNITELDTTEYSGTKTARMHSYKADKTLAFADSGYFAYLANYLGKGSVEGSISMFTAGYSGVNQTTLLESSEVAYVRFCGKLLEGHTLEDVVVTVNEEIIYSVGTEYKWVNTGISYTSADYSDDIAEIKSDIDDLEKAISNLKSTSTGDSIPSYWVSELETKADTIQQIMESVGRNKSSFYWYTDVHWQTNAKKSPILLKYLTDNTQINKINCGGDVINDPSPYNHVNTKYVHDWRKQIANLPNHHTVLGNHDLNHWSTDVRKMAYANILAHQETNDMVVGGDGYYYIDNPSEKTRYLYLCYLTKSQADMMAQGQFIVDAISSAEENWHIVVISHRWFQYASSHTPTTGSIPTYEKEILDIFDKYNAKTIRNGSNYFYAQDFTNCKGKVEFCIGGHIHADYDFTTDGGIPVIITTSDTNQQRHNDDVDYGVLGTTTEQAVYAIIADYEGGKINVVGIGRGNSRQIDLY
jgi:hypothetical protein